jgi:hypothetical protein
MKNIVSFEIKKSTYDGYEFYCLFIDGKFHNNYTSLSSAKRALKAIINL